MENAMTLMKTGNVSVKEINKAFINACSNENVNIVEWLASAIPNQSDLDIDYALKVAMKNYATDVVKLILDIKPSLISVICSNEGEWQKTNQRLFEHMVYAGKLDFAKWFLGLVPTLDISNGDEIPFRFACHNGHLETAKWLLTVKPDIDVSAEDDDAFNIACIHGHFDVVKWLYEIKPSINITRFNFKDACENANKYMDERMQVYYNGTSYKHLDVAKWILEVKPSIEHEMKYDFGELFITVCENASYEYTCYGKEESFDIVKWLIQLRPSLKNILIRCEGKYAAGAEICMTHL
jgi:hypothetical protein